MQKADHLPSKSQDPESQNQVHHIFSKASKNHWFLFGSTHPTDNTPLPRFPLETVRSLDPETNDLGLHAAR